MFNEFFICLDAKPKLWEDRVILFAAYLIDKGRKSTTVKSYISAIRAVLAEVDISVNENKYLLSSLTRAYRLTRDQPVRLRLPIGRDILNMVLQTTLNFFFSQGQSYLAWMYSSLFAIAYHGLFRVGDLTKSQHEVKACNVHIVQNK